MMESAPLLNVNQQQVNSLGFDAVWDSRGLNQLLHHCKSIYPSTTPHVLKTDTPFIISRGSVSESLDPIHIYKNEGNLKAGIPKHWHYVGFGLSDTHGYNVKMYHLNMLRNQCPAFADAFSKMDSLPQWYPLHAIDARISGFGFELTFRVKCNSDESWAQEPPKWPCDLMQKLAEYVFRSKNMFNANDHFAWRCPLDSEDSHIRHMLMTLDPQLRSIDTVHGSVKFIQIVGVCDEELQAAREWRVNDILEIMKEREETGGNYLVTDMRRGESIFDLDPENLMRVESGIREHGSDLYQFTVLHKISSRKPGWFSEVENLHTENRSEEFESATDNDIDMGDPSGGNYCNSQGLERGNLLTMPREDGHALNDYALNPVRNSSRMSYESESALDITNIEMVETRYYDSIYLLLDYESAKVLPVVLTGRLAHRRPFHFKKVQGDLLTTLVPDGWDERESLVSRERPYAKRGFWLQIYVPRELQQQMLEQIKPDFAGTRPINLPRNYCWPEFKFYLTVVEKIKDSSYEE